jgi:hypothetical protein
MPAEAVTWAALAVAIGSVLSLIGFWTRYSDRITKAEAAAHAASILAYGDTWKYIDDEGLPNARPIALSDSPRCHRSHNSVFRGRRKPSTKALIHRHTPSFPFKIKCCVDPLRPSPTNGHRPLGRRCLKCAQTRKWRR